jgi:hypothetical protein
MRAVSAVPPQSFLLRRLRRTTVSDRAEADVLFSTAVVLTSDIR